MDKIKIPESEFFARISKLKIEMEKEGVDAVTVYGDEYRKENLRYISNYWPIFERGVAIISLTHDPILLCAAEGEMVAREMSVIKDVRLVPDFACVTVPDEIKYPLAKFTSLGELAKELGPVKKLGVVGIDAMSPGVLDAITKAFDTPIIDFNKVFFDLRREKSENEIKCLKEAARLADIGYEELMKASIPGNTELMAASAAEGAARAAGAEAIIFTVFGSGDRTNTIVGRPTSKVIEDGDMLMASFAVQYEGYVATVEMPFVSGTMSVDSKRVIDTLVKAEAAGLPFLKPGIKMKNFVSSVQDYFKKEGLGEYDVYPPLHGCGCSEAESPYPHGKTEEVFKVGMTVNTDISLFGLKGGSNRIEEGYVITENGAESMSQLVRKYCKEWLKNN
jgi:Xaa-Pro aminopeptidase